MDTDDPAEARTPVSSSVGSSLALNGSSVIGENAGVFVGGLPHGYAILRRDAGEFGAG